VSDTDGSTPAWWQEADPLPPMTEEQRAEVKNIAARQVLGYLLNVPHDSAEARRVRGWHEPDDFPGALYLVAVELWRDYDGDVWGLAWRMIAGNMGDRIKNGVLLTEMYWDASLASIEEASRQLRDIRKNERTRNALMGEMQRLSG